MTTIAVTGSTGHLGRLIVESLLERDVPAHDIVAIARTPEKAADLTQRGVQVRQADYSDPDSLPAALDGVDRLVLVSGSEMGQRAVQHANVITAAEAAGVSRIVYTSVLKADSTSLGLAPEHLATEQALAASSIPATVLRNSWYLENYTSQVEMYTSTGSIVGATGGAALTAGTRADFAEAAAVAALQDAEDVTYEIGGVSFTMEDLAAAVTAATGVEVAYVDMTVAELAATFEQADMDAATAGFWASIDGSIAAGDLHTHATDLADLIGRQPTSLIDAVTRAAQH